MPSALLIDDDESNRITLSMLLEDEGFTVDQADCVAEARARIEASDAIDIVLLDMHLGDGTARDVLPLLRERLPGCPVMLLSGSMGPMGQEEPLEVEAVIVKGRPFPELLAAIRAAMAGGRR